jgi:nitroreductase
MQLIDALKWRYATKRMNGQKVPTEQLENILEAIRLSASSFGLQPFTILVVENEELRKKIQPVAYNQPQILEASHLLVFAGWSDVTEAHVTDYISNIAETRKGSVDSLADFKGMMMGMVNGQPQNVKSEWAARQAYIALGTAMVAAAFEKVDATPMEGFDPAAVDAILGLQEKGLRSVSILALGYRDEQNDYLANATKVRRNKESLFIELP